MFVRVLGPALAVAVVVGMAAEAQTLRNVTAPVNPPPASFKGQQFIDSRGCVFVRAGFGGQVNWVPRIDGSKRPICGMMPTGAAPQPLVAEVEIPQVAPTTQTPTAPQRPRGPGLFAFLFAPAPAPAPMAAPTRAEQVVTFAPPPTPRVLPTPPKGWTHAWKDDRLNPMRGIGTAEGQAAQNRVYTQDVPMVAIADLPPQKQAKAIRAAQVAAPKAQHVAAQPVTAPQVTVSTMSAPAAGLLIQVGAFGQPANAEKAAGRIAGLGLAATTSGQKLRVVFAGPFASTDAAQAALVALRAGGFPDAFLR
ncbi:SPOR domain-containing protein [Rhodobacter sp. KR11]|uniref:SPOR domain-containing protein n=1 Tax=Rhodobacter sp. KR11 TaxID=2974588 RepID=UPI002222D79E|nr:SPOR domain-containing protein [Rhodobacter sp. KR11]MCW1918725.1 SPOR domain-containing protein [Rhodobacter sp. KR11]